MIKRIVNRLGKQAFGFYPLKTVEDFGSFSRAFFTLSSMVTVAIESAPVQTLDSNELGGLFNKAGSDKAQQRHQYHKLYASLLAGRRNEPLSVLEIGIGTSNPKLPSSMGGWETKYTPGGSLRAFRDFLPNAQIVGADVDRQCLFTENRIKTYFVDQLSRGSLTVLFADQKFDLIVDDGLHTPEANINTLVAALHHLKYGGSIVIEDLGDDVLEFWKIAACLIPIGFKARLVKTGTINNVFVVTKI